MSLWRLGLQNAWVSGRAAAQSFRSLACSQLAATPTPSTSERATQPESPPSSSSTNWRSFATSATPGSQPILGKNTAVLEEQPLSWPAQPPRQKLKALYRPWDHTRQLACKPGYPTRMGFLIQALEEEHVQRVQQQRRFPDFKSGDILEVRMMVPENQRRQYIYRGVCIARYHKGVRSTFKLYNVFPDGGAVVQHLPLYMPDIQEIKIIGKVQAGSRVKKYHILENMSSKYTFQKQVRAYKEDASSKEASTPP